MPADPVRPAQPRLITRRILFRVHWAAGLVAGVVLAIVGVTGAMIGFEAEWLAWLNPGYQTPSEGRSALSADAWIARAQATAPKLDPRSLSWAGDERPVRVRLASGRDRGVAVALNPYSGEVLGPERGAGALAMAEDLHRRLAAGPIGKQFVGASTVLLIVMLASGVYLRWPGRPRAVSAWLKPNLRLRGRALLWNLHAVVGTWLLAAYLLAALTGLWWSYDGYRNLINGFAGVEGPLRRPAESSHAKGATPSVSLAWSAFRSAVPDARRASLRLPGKDDAIIEVRYQDPRSAHERAWDSLRIDRESGDIVERRLHRDEPAGRRFVAALFPLHSGSWFGTPGRVLMALASLLMPLFTVSGLWLWWLRRRRAKQRRGDRRDLVPTTAPRHARTAGSR